MKKTKKPLCFLLAAVMLAAFVMSIGQHSQFTGLVSTNVEALTDCEIVKNNGEVIKFKCEGEGKCSHSFMGHTLYCDGTQQK